MTVSKLGSELRNMSNVDKKIAGILVILLSLGMIYHSIQIIHGEVSYPVECTRRRLLCELTNFIFAQGGYFGIGMLHLAFSLFIFGCGYVLLVDKS